MSLFRFPLGRKERATPLASALAVPVTPQVTAPDPEVGKVGTGAASPAAFCPYCGVELVPPPKASKKCPHCGQKIHRQTVKHYRAWAKEQGLLEGEGPLPALGELEKLVQTTLPEKPPPQC